MTERQCRYVVGVSWPRSGHHLLVNMLKNYFGKEFVYCEFYVPNDCCKTVPCARAPAVTFTKNHDFDLQTPITPGFPYLIQYRAFLPSVVSAFELFVRSGKPNTPEAFRTYARNMAVGYNAFLWKWVIGTACPNEKLVCSYEEITSDNKIALFSNIIKFFAPNHSVNEDRLTELTESVQKMLVEDGNTTIISEFGIKAARNVEHFRFYDKEFFAELQELTRKSEQSAISILV